MVEYPFDRYFDQQLQELESAAAPSASGEEVRSAAAADEEKKDVLTGADTGGPPPPPPPPPMPGLMPGKCLIMLLFYLRPTPMANSPNSAASGCAGAGAGDLK